MQYTSLYATILYRYKDIPGTMQECDFIEKGLLAYNSDLSSNRPRNLKNAREKKNCIFCSLYVLKIIPLKFKRNFKLSDNFKAQAKIFIYGIFIHLVLIIFYYNIYIRIIFQSISIHISKLVFKSYWFFCRLKMKHD